MRSFRSEPFLWIHLAGIAVVPLSLQVVWLGLAVGTPLPFFWLELLLVAAVGIVPVFWMQWQRPFSIFSLLILAVKPEEMMESQRQILSLLKSNRQRFLSAIAAIVMLLALWQLYQLAPIVVMAASIVPPFRLLGLLIASVAFLVSNLFFQVPVSVLGVFLTSPEKSAAREPYPVAEIEKDFTLTGWRVGQILSENTEASNVQDQEQVIRDSAGEQYN